MKVGDYARSSEGDFGKIVIINNSHDIELEDSWVSYDEEDLKSSPNIIDLIEVGDYVNGKKVVNKQYHYTDKDNYDMGEWCIFYENVALGDYQYDIKSIITHEQFSQMEYKVKE